jgi:4'-phosphopantetheinyl transferase EntD
VIERLLPTAVVAVEAFEDVPGEECFPGEEDLIAKAVDGRRREFITARRCAREALGVLGFPPAPIRPGPRREPQWPGGVTGSITHCAGYRAAAVARTAEVGMIGIDAEPNGPLPDGVLEAIALPAEIEWLKDAGNSSGVCWDRLLFSAKESIYKAWFPLTRRWLDFEEAVVTPDPAEGTFTARLLVSGPIVDGRALTGFAGRWTVDRGLVATAITVLAE